MPGPMTKVGVRSSSTLNFFFFFFKGLLCPVGVVMFSLEHHFSQQQKKYVVIFFCLLNFLPPLPVFKCTGAQSVYLSIHAPYFTRIYLFSGTTETYDDVYFRQKTWKKTKNKNEKKKKSSTPREKQSHLKRRKIKIYGRSPSSTSSLCKLTNNSIKMVASAFAFLKMPPQFHH